MGNSYNIIHIILKSQNHCTRFAKVMLKTLLNCLPSPSASRIYREHTHQSNSGAKPTHCLAINAQKGAPKGHFGLCLAVMFLVFSLTVPLSQLCSQRKDLPNCCRVLCLICFYPDIFQHRQIYKLSYYCSEGVLFMLLLRTLMDIFAVW